MEEQRAGKHTELPDFIFSHFQKRVGIVTAVVEMGYNLLYGLHKASYDADCALFLNVLRGDTKEDVYIQTAQLQDELVELFASMDKAKGGIETGFISKDEVQTALESFFRVGEPNGKTADRFDELMKALDEDQPGERVEHRKVFEEDRDFNQGEFAEAVRNQFMEERMDYFRAVETALYEESGFQEECTKAMALVALLRVDHDLTEKQAATMADGAFQGETGAVKAVMRRLQRGSHRRGCGSTGSIHRASSVSKIRAAISDNKRKGKTSAAIDAALEAVRKSWIERELNSKPANPFDAIKTAAAVAAAAAGLSGSAAAAAAATKTATPPVAVPAARAAAPTSPGSPAKESDTESTVPAAQPQPDRLGNRNVARIFSKRHHALDKIMESDGGSEDGAE